MKNNKHNLIKMKSILLLIAILVPVFIFRINVVFAQEESRITLENAQIIAEHHVGSTLLLSEDGIIDDWHWGIAIEKGFSIYDINNDITSYYFKLADENSADAGYVIIGANQNNPPIIEYSTAGEFYPVDILSKEKIKLAKTNKIGEELKIYYDGGIDYFVGDNEAYFDLSGEEIVVSDISRIKNDSLNYLEEWDFWNEFISEQLLKAPPNYGVAITDPKKYEYGYYKVNVKNISTICSSYLEMNDFGGYYNHCYPTVGANLMYHWYSADKSKYAKLRKGDDSAWLKTFESLYSLMKTTNEGTLNVDLPLAYRTYLKEAGFTDPTVNLNNSARWDNITTEIKSGYPFHLIVQSHNYYGDHGVLALGYSEYLYTLVNVTESRYIRVADGWTTSNSRYVYFNSGSNAIRMVQVRP